MEMLKTQIKNFLDIDYHKSYGCGQACGDGGECGAGSGYAVGSGITDTYGYGDERIDDSSIGEGYGYYSNLDNELGYGYGYGYCNNIKEINSETIYIVDEVPTIIKSVHDNIARGFILQDDLTLKPCYIVKEQNKFAHGSTLHEAFNDLQEKLYDDSTEEERIEAFHKKFPEYNVPYSNRDLFTYHHILTGSCHMGRESFCKDMGIDLDGSTTVQEFILLTKNSYGSSIIHKLPKVYGINE